MRRVLALALAVAAALASCGGDDEPATTSAATTDTVPELTAPVATTTDETTLTAESADGDEGGDGGGGGAAATPTDAEGVIEAVFTGSLPAATICDQLLTAAYVKEAYGSGEGCLAGEKPGALAESVTVKDLDETTGEATVVPTGGPYDGVEVEVTLVNDGGIRVDSLKANIPAGP